MYMAPRVGGSGSGGVGAAVRLQVGGRLERLRARVAVERPLRAVNVVRVRVEAPGGGKRLSAVAAERLDDVVHTEVVS